MLSSAFRLQGCQPDVDVWQRILQIRALVLNPEDDAITWIKFANLCRKSERMFLAEKTINSLLTPEKVRHVRPCLCTCMISIAQLQLPYHGRPGTKAPPNVVYAHLKYMWANGAREESLDFLRKFTSSLARDLHPDTAAQTASKKLDELSRLLARCCFKQGQWQVDMYEDWSDVSRPTSREHVQVLIARSVISKTSFTRTTLRRITIRRGTRLGMLGRWRTLRSWVSWRRRSTTERTFQARSWLCILYKP